MKKQFELPYRFNPRSYQTEVVEARSRGIRFFCTVWHRRSGKDKFWLNFLICEALQHPGNYYFTLPTYRQAKQNVWVNLDDAGKPFMFEHIPDEFIKNKNATDLMVELNNGSFIQLIGTDNLDRIRGCNPRGIVFSEYSLQSPAAWLTLQPIIAANPEKWVAFNFTPKGDNHAHDLYEGALKDPTWFVSLKTIEDTKHDAENEHWFGTPIVTPEYVQNQMREKGVDEDFIRQEMYCSFKGSTTGAFYSELMKRMQDEGRCAPTPWDSAKPVFTVWDLGLFDAMVCLYAQWQGNYLAIIDYQEWHARGLLDCLKEVQAKPYNYSQHYAPHDIAARELTSGRSRQEVAREFGVNFRTVENLSVQDGIDSVRGMLSRVKIDTDRAKLLVRCLEQYHRKPLDDLGMKFSEIPDHDWSSHGADAVRYLSLVFEREHIGRQINVEASGLDSDPFSNEPFLDGESETEW